jgi:hypothetical protein
LKPISEHRRLLAALAAYKALLLAFVGALPWLWPGAFNLATYQANVHWPADAPPSWSTLYATWDSLHFLHLSREGYQPGAPWNNFYPLWPALIRLGAAAVASPLISALILSNLFSLAAAALLFLYIKDMRNETLARHSVLLLLAYPGAFFLCLPFSESLFMLLAAALFLSLSRRRWGWAAACAFLLPLARPQGVLVAGAYWYALGKSRKTSIPDLSLWLAPVAGELAYFAFMLYAVGDAFAGVKLYHQIFPGSPALSELWNLKHFFAAFFQVTCWHGIRGSLMDRLWFALYLSCLPALWRHHRGLFWYALPMGLVPAMTLSFVSYTRHLLLVFPVFIVAADWLEKRPLLRWSVLAASFALQLILLARHANNYWVA